ncbi:MAG TPA: beta-N-acetylhexosaminidase [Candidatus Baltobacteraceae bacterium]|nr:beta-N-acetylhexosaminidase [Candidatus Baltobacteraceae bacterium]
MTDIRTLAAGVVCVGFDGTRIAPDLARKLRETPLAGLILFARNIASLAQARALTDAIREIMNNPIIAIDQEGGRVARLRDGVEELPAMLALGATGDTELARRAGAQLAFDLRRAGFNVDYAPVLDLMLMRMNTVIGSRAFGNDPQQVARFGDAFARGLRSQGIIPTFKHFPGHGSTEVDSHLDLPAIDLDEGTFRDRDLVPFAKLLPGAQALMTAHIIVRSLDAERPATLSPRILTSLLREEIGFEGVCFTDCMQMDAISKGVGSTSGAVQAVIAGADCVLISHSFDLALESIDRLVDAVNDGSLPKARLEQAYERVQTLRAALQPPLPLDAQPPYAGVGREIGRRAVTVLRGSAQAAGPQSIIVSFEGTTVEGVQGLHTEHASLAGGAGVPELRLPLEPQSAAVDELVADVQKRGKRPIVLMRRAHVYKAQADAVRALLNAFPDALLVSTREPFDAFMFDSAQNVLCTYGDDKPSMEGLSDVLFGGAPAQGTFPLGDAVAASN